MRIEQQRVKDIRIRGMGMILLMITTDGDDTEAANRCRSRAEIVCAVKGYVCTQISQELGHQRTPFPKSTIPLRIIRTAPLPAGKYSVQASSFSLRSSVPRPGLCCMSSLLILLCLYSYLGSIFKSYIDVVVKVSTSSYKARSRP